MKRVMAITTKKGDKGFAGLYHIFNIGPELALSGEDRNLLTGEIFQKEVDC
jgi:hypothetical protein